MSLAQEIITAIQNAIGKQSAVLHEPRFSGNESKYIQECIDSTYVSSVGKFVDRFEEELSDYTGAKHVIAVVNGTAALHVSLMITGVEPGDEVLVPALSFVATANAVRYCGAEPHFVDCEERTLGMDPEALRSYLKSIETQFNERDKQDSDELRWDFLDMFFENNIILGIEKEFALSNEYIPKLKVSDLNKSDIIKLYFYE